MKYHLKKTYFTNQKRIIENYGDSLFEVLCDNLEGYWTLANATSVLEKTYGYKPRTARLYASAVIKNVIAESGDDVITKIGNCYIFK